MSNNLQPKISICIPTYNGLPYITVLMDELLNSSCTNFDIVISDDCSTDGTWEYVSALSSVDDRVKCFRNSNNLGMDGNFSKSVEVATGEYAWLCGQDDIIMHQGIEVVTKLLTDKPELDFVYLNHVKVNEVSNQNVNFAMHLNFENKHTYGHGFKEFVNYHDFELPTFLPKYVLRKALWEPIDVTKYFGTIYCQVGVFIELSEHIEWCHLDGNYVVGLTPSNGWQTKPSDFTKISLGMYLMLYIASKQVDWLESSTLKGLVDKNYKRLILAFILIKSHKIHFSDKSIGEILEVVKYSPILYLVVVSIYKMPTWFSLIILKIISARRVFRKNILSLAPQGPKID